jgi:hypothetical protein
VECDSVSSLIMEVEAGRGIELVPTTLKLMSGKRLIYRPLTGTTETQSVGIARATKDDVTPAGENFAKPCGENLFRRKPKRHAKLLAGAPGSGVGFSLSTSPMVCSHRERDRKDMSTRSLSVPSPHLALTVSRNDLGSSYRA